MHVIRTSSVHQARRFFAVYSAKRSSQFSLLEATDVQHFNDIVGPKGLITEPDQIKPFNTDWTKKFVGRSQLVLRP